MLSLIFIVSNKLLFLGTTNSTNHNHNVAIPSTNFKRQNTIDAASIKENTARLNSRPENIIGMSTCILLLLIRFLLHFITMKI